MSLAEPDGQTNQPGEQTKPTGKIEFIENHRPALPSGDYAITVTQSIETRNTKLIEKRPFVSETRKFSVQGPRFSLEPQVIRAVFPPAGSLGEHSSVLPHVSFHRSTLPWERFAEPLTQKEENALEKKEQDRNAEERRLADSPKLKTPWLALLIFDQSELVETELVNGKPVEHPLTAGKVSGPRTCTLKGEPLGAGKAERWLLDPGAAPGGPSGLVSPVFPREFAQHEGDPVTVIDVAEDLLQKVLPSLQDARLLAHVRKPTDPAGDEVATILANRLPKPGSMSTAHLVSLEGEYAPDKRIWDRPDGAFYRLVSLKSWRFTCVSEAHSFKGLLQALDRSPLRLPAVRLDRAGQPVLDGAGKPVSLDKADKPVRQGFVAVPHEMRQGNKTVSWYHGPLAPGEVRERQPPGDPARPRSADRLLRYDPRNGMFDVSYSAAWELGRLLTLQNEQVARSLFDWKRRHRHGQERQRAMRALEHLPITGQAVAAELPAEVASWFADLAVLRGVPFNYLVPDERLLPPESIRFFQVDPYWVRCLHDGAFSIGRVLPLDQQRDDGHGPQTLPPPHAMVTGFLLRSEVVSGWPDLQVDAYDEPVDHENYEHPTRPAGDGVLPLVEADSALLAALKEGDAATVAARFRVRGATDLAVSSIVPESSWLLNVDQNETLYRIDRAAGRLRISIENKLPPLRFERLSPNVLICMFAGDAPTFDIHQKPEALHFGVNRGASYHRDLKTHLGGELTREDVKSPDIPWKGTVEERVIAVAKLNGTIQKRLQSITDARLREVAKRSVGDDQQRIKTFVGDFKGAAAVETSAQFALQMIEGVEKVRFVVGG